jgi:hypothetical protein
MHTDRACYVTLQHLSLSGYILLPEYIHKPSFRKFNPEKTECELTSLRGGLDDDPIFQVLEKIVEFVQEFEQRKRCFSRF